MKTATLKLADRELAVKCRVARDFFSRLMGLMGRKTIPADEALLFPKCNSIHTFFMRFPIDVIFVSKDGTVVDVIEAMAPWRMLLPRQGAKHTIEMAGGRSRELGIEKGARLGCEGVWA